MAELTPTPSAPARQSSGVGSASVQYVEQMGNRPQRDAASVEVKTQQFEKLLNDQQQITELQTAQRGDTFDPASDIAQNAVFGQSGLATPL